MLFDHSSLNYCRSSSQATTYSNLLQRSYIHTSARQADGNPAKNFSPWLFSWKAMQPKRTRRVGRKEIGMHGEKFLGYLLLQYEQASTSVRTYVCRNGWFLVLSSEHTTIPEITEGKIPSNDLLFKKYLAISWNTLIIRQTTFIRLRPLLV